MCLIMTTIWIILLVLYLHQSTNLLLSLILVELVSFISLAILIINLQASMSSDYLVMMMFSLFVIESIIALSGMIALVSTSGSDYLVNSSTLKC